ncbi:MAG: nitrilase-related carbon-nitrogen hydrolase [Anaerolineae bacterium]
MSEIVIAVVQQQMRVYDAPEDYQKDIYRFLDLAQTKGAQLVIFPALSPVMLIPPLASGTKLSLLKKSQQRQGGFSSFLDRLLGRAARTAIQAMGGVRKELGRLLDEYPAELYEAYIDLFSAAALKFQTTIVAGSFYLRENEESNCKHVTYVFGPDGLILGAQEKVHLTVQEMGFCQAGDAFRAIETPVGRLGILIGEDALFPEAARHLAYQRADILVSLVASEGLVKFRQLRHAFLARVDENETLGVQGCAVGLNLLNPNREDLVGRAALLAPIPMSDRGDGVLYEIGAATVEGYIIEAVSREALRDYWVRTEPRLRQSMRLLAYQQLARHYKGLRTLDQVFWIPKAGKEVAPPAPSSSAGQTPDLAGDPYETPPPETGLDFNNASRKLGIDLYASPFSDEEDEG